MKKIIVIFLVVCLAAPTAWLLLREEPQGPISESRVIAIIKAHIAEADNIPHENIRIDKIELRPPTKAESEFWGEEPPELIWFADVTRLFGDVGPRAGIIWLDAHTGEIIYGSFLD